MNKPQFPPPRLIEEDFIEPFKILKAIKNRPYIYVPSFWFGVLLAYWLLPQQAMGFFLGTVWGVVWMVVYQWWHNK